MKCTADYLFHKCLVEMQKYLQYINTLEYEQEPDYEHLRKLFKDGLKKRGCTDDGRTVKFKSGQANTMSTSDADTLCSSYDAETRNGSSRQKPVVKVTVNDIPVKKYNYRSMLGDMRNVWVMKSIPVHTISREWYSFLSGVLAPFPQTTTGNLAYTSYKFLKIVHKILQLISN